MRRITLYLAVFSMVFLFSCAKEDTTIDSSTNVTLEDRGPQPKIDICHYDEDNNTWHVINVNLNAWPAHEGHGDVRLDDQDGDGYYPDNECGVGPMGDCDDLDASINPGAEEICGDGIDQDCDGVDESCVCDVCPAYTYDEVIAIAEQITFWWLPHYPSQQWAFAWSGGPNFGVDADDYFARSPNGTSYSNLTVSETECCIEIVQAVADYLGIEYIVSAGSTSNSANNTEPPLLVPNNGQ